MSARKSRLVRVGALLPLAAVSVAWTASMAGVGGASLVVAEAPQQAPSSPTALPDGTALPSQAVEAPASVTGDGSLLGTGSADATQIVSTASTSGIPSAALAAYQRAETVINSADTTCRLPWQLVAAIGRVESNHGRANGNVLADDGLATPGIYGIALDGTNATSVIADTDAGALDDDTSFDRAVGPMQFIPSTWSVVGVDADGDGQRNPQDVNDAALASAVYLCSGTDDLSTPEGQQAAVFRYNHSQSYVDLVLSVMQAYMSGDFTSIPNSAVAAGVIAPQPAPVGGGNGAGTDDGRSRIGGGDDSTKKSATKKPTATPTPTPTPTPRPTPTPQPTPNGDGGTKGNGNGSGGNGNNNGNVPAVPVPTLDVPTLPTTGVAPVDQLLTQTQALTQCALDLGLGSGLNLTALTGLLNLSPNGDLAKCVTRYTTAP